MKVGKLIVGNAEFSLEYFKNKGFNGFCCSNCNDSIFLDLHLYGSGKSIYDLAELDNNLIDTFLGSKIVSKQKGNFSNINKIQYKILNLEAEYAIVNCNNCSGKFIVIFGIGDTQPGREQVILKGIWELI